MNVNQFEGFRQPKALYLLFAVQMWECFSFYGMRVLLVLYLVSKLGFSDLRAYGIYAIYGSLVEFGGILGGRLADKVLGLRKAIALGGWLIAAGHLCITYEGESYFLFAGLALIVTGSSLFSTNISALLGQFYEENDSRREQGFTLFYVGINSGALLAGIFCGIVGEKYGWHYGFGLAAIGMIAGNLLLYSLRGVLDNKGLAPSLVWKRNYTIGILLLMFSVPLSAVVIAYEDFSLKVLPWVSLACAAYIGFKMLQSREFKVQNLAHLGLYLGALALFFAAEDQIASSLLILSERHSSGTLLGFAIPSTALLSLNPLAIILGGTLFARIFRNRGKDSVTYRITLALVISAATFGGIAFACRFPDSDGFIPLSVIAAGIAAVSIAELLLAPAVYAFCSTIAPQQWLGATMGLIPLGYSLASLISGIFSRMVAVEASEDALSLFYQAYGRISILLALAAVALIWSDTFLQKIYIRKSDVEARKEMIS